MKKLFLLYAVIFAVFGLVNSNAMQIPNQSNNTSYSTERYYIEFMHYSNSYGLSFFKTGNCRHWTPENRYDCRSGKYYVQDEIIYITWDNGQQERLKLQYDKKGRAYVYYRGRYYYDGYSSNN